MKAILAILFIAILAGGTAYLAGAFDVETTEPDRTETQAPATQITDVVPLQSSEIAMTVEERTVNGVELPPAFFQKLPPLARVPMQLNDADFSSGIKTPLGFLPTLNGVPDKDAPPLPRQVDVDGPYAPVVAKATDSEGWEWYEHADGSYTTTRPTKMVDNGKEVDGFVTKHTISMDQNLGLSPGGMIPPKDPR